MCNSFKPMCSPLHREQHDRPFFFASHACECGAITNARALHERGAVDTLTRFAVAGFTTESQGRNVGHVDLKTKANNKDNDAA